MRVVQVDVDVIEEVITHEIVIALRVVVAQAAILIQVIGTNLGKVDVALLVPINELVIRANGRAARGKAQHRIRLQDDLSGDDVGRLAAHVIIVARADDLQHTDWLDVPRFRALPLARRDELL